MMVAVEDSTRLQSDDSLASNIHAGDRRAEDELVRRYYGRTLAITMALIRDRQAARELSDDVLMATLTALRRGTVNDTAHLEAFIHGTALNLAHGYLRAIRRQLRTVTIDPNFQRADTTIDDRRDEDFSAARRCIERLPVKDQRVLMLTLVEGLKPGEIALLLGMSAETVRQQKSRALQAIREMLEPASRVPTPGSSDTT